MKRWKELENAVEDLLILKKIPYVHFKYRCYKCGSILKSKRGFPDFLCFVPTKGKNMKILCVECKTGKGKLTPEQQEIMIYFYRSGIEYIVLRDTLDQLLEYLQ